MSDSIYTPFFMATSEVFKLLLDLDVSAGKPEVLHNIAGCAKSVDVVIGLTGDLTGEILYRFPVDMTLEIVKIMSGMDINEIDDFVASALGEVANIISGNAMTALSDRKVICDILPPRIVLDGNKSLNAGSDAPIISIKVLTPLGNVELDMQIKAG